MKVVGIIPCRFGASRFPGKSLADIHGKPMMWHVHRQASKVAMLDETWVATDDDRIAQACGELSLPVVMTHSDHPTGTDRLVECVSMIDADIYVNVQGDEPMIEPEAIELVAMAIVENRDDRVMASNGYQDIADPSEAVDVNVVKVALKVDGLALAYSRLPIPFPRGGTGLYRRQLGLYAFRRKGLEIFGDHQPGPVEQAEGVEMLRFIEHGFEVAMVKTPADHAVSVDTPEDLERVRSLMATD
ncbi:MAG: 3-deoxy-manno-octulosonate cytidylyltransferase [Planctomycetaceae bacterium]|nr:3-deoxy-manno-octulosonate cytidylyltransferase [Planctomycetaceae bacterium]